MLSSQSTDYLARLKDAVANVSALGRLSSWLTRNTQLGGKAFSLKGHEYQEAIIDSTHPNSGIIKPSQVGATELSTRLVLAFLAVTTDAVGLYLFPTVVEALRFSKSRIDPIIRGSRQLKESIIAGSDSASFKQLGTSQLYVGGTFGKAVISIPVDLLVIDEYDFANMENCVTAESRMSHSSLYNEELDIRGIRKKFSTATVPGYGVSAIFERSNQLSRMVRCKHCHEWFWPNFLNHVVVQGFDNTMEELDYTTAQDLDDRGLLETAKLLCENCHNPVTKANLMPEYRQWVAAKPEVKHTECWRVSPFDLPDYHTPTSLLRKLIQYEGEIGHFRNFTLGLPYSDASNSVLPGAVRDNTVLVPEYPDSASCYGTVLGLDVGKTSWLTIAKPYRVNGVEELHILWMERILIGTNDEDSLVSIVAERVRQFKVIRGVVDAMPYTTSMLKLQSLFPEGMIMPCMYTLTDRKLPSYIINEKNWAVDANRTKVINSVVKRVNQNRMKFARCPDIQIMERHLQGMKRIDQLDEHGSFESRWVATGDDHYFHSLVYAGIAAQEVETDMYTGWAPSFSVKQAFIGKQAPQLILPPGVKL